jgi:chondroitin-sulfate-ABC endolyase/exolyase
MNTTLVAFAIMLSASAVACGQETQYESFEDGVPAYFVATRAASLSLSPLHSKQGKNSLRWDWQQGEELVIRHGIGDVSRKGGIGKAARAGFAVWVYVEKPIAGALVFEFRQGEKVTGFFRFPLEYTGWWQGRPSYLALPGGKLTAKVDNIRVGAPRAVAKGTVFLDFIKYNTLTHPGREIFPEREAQWQRPVPDERRHPRPDRVTEAERASIRELLGPDMGPGIIETRVKSLCGQVKALGIVRDEHGVRGGPAIDRHYQYCCEFGEHGVRTQNYWPDENGPGWLGVQDPVALTSLAYQVASAYRASRDAEQRRRLAEAFLLVEDHLFDQGMQAAAGFHCNWWYGGAWADAVFLMRDVLAREGRLARQCDYFLWNWGGNEIFAETDPTSHSDYYLLVVPRLLRACLMQVEPTEQVRWLRAFKAMLERSILQPSSALKIDGSAYHHGGHYFGYTFASVPGLAEIVQSLSGTPWRLNAEAHERLRRAALAQRIFCNQRDVPLSLSGRQPFVEYCGRLRPEGLDYLARSGTPDGKQAIDPETAAAYLRLVPEAASKQPYRSLGIKPESEPNGCFVMPYAALLCQRRDNWLASVHGQSKYIWGTERQTKVNCFGLFQGLGHLDILAGGKPVSAKASGREKLGWDWRRFEGTTVPQLPLDKIDKGWTTPYSPETFVGGLSHQGRQGLFAMILNQPMPGGKTLKGRKSWFFHDDRILCLGSNISSDEAEYPTQTTLCQRALPRNKKAAFLPTRLDGADFTGFPEERALDEASPHWFLDVQQTGYYLPAGQKTTVARRNQKSREYQDQGDTEGDFLTAWLDHGKSPSAAGYEYVAVVQATPEAMQKIVAEPPYRVLQRDQSAHIVWDTAGRLWGCVLFVPQEVIAHKVATEMLPIKTVDRPCLIMAAAVRDGLLNMTVTDPDLNLGRAKGQSGSAALPPRPLRVNLHGAWRLPEATGTVCAWRLPNASENVRILSTSATETVLEIPCQHGASYDVRLARQ